MFSASFDEGPELVIVLLKKSYCIEWLREEYRLTL